MYIKIWRERTKILMDRENIELVSFLTGEFQRTTHHFLVMKREFLLVNDHKL